ncbi:hypothetical protein [Arcobacter peruensis]|uniref:hypothetical protein n=1 Tax=Arcobacter peruensis TaxID=2320140 RepID=UPI000F091D3B|nr:hypothetical protein [Arcobacter peruensis]
MKFFLSFFLLLGNIYAIEKYETIKTSCIQTSEHSGKSQKQLKDILIKQAKRDAIGELYGSLILSKTDVKDGKLVSDEIKQKAVGSVRIKGNPKFYNGVNFGEICSDINAYITKKDLEKYSLKQMTLQNFCFNDTTVATKDIKQKAKEKAYREILTKYKPSLKNISLSQAQELIHDFSISNDKFDFNTGSYCFKAVGSLYPYEVELYKPQTNKNMQQKVIVQKEPIQKPSSTIEKKQSNTSDKIYFSNDYLEGKVLYEIIGDKVHIDILIDNVYRNLKGGVSVSFPQLMNSRRIIDTSSNRLSKLDIYEKNSKLWNTQLRKVIRSSYLLVESWQSSWKKYKTQSISMIVDMDRMDRLVLNVRSVLVNKKKQSLLPAFGEKDQQGFPIKQIIIKR